MILRFSIFEKFLSAVNRSDYKVSDAAAMMAPGNFNFFVILIVIIFLIIEELSDDKSIIVTRDKRTLNTSKSVVLIFSKRLKFDQTYYRNIDFRIT